MNRSDDKFLQEAKARFDESVDDLDAATLSTLNRGRHGAIDEAGRHNPTVLRWVPVTGVAVAVLAGVMVLQPEPTTIDPLPASVDDMEILLGEESIEMLENLEFYASIDALEQDDDVG